MATYNKIGKGYDFTRKADPYLAERMFQLLKSEHKGGTYLDIGCGTGNYTTALNHKGLPLMGIDPSEEMLGKAIKKNPDILWKIGSAENIDLPSGSVNGVLLSLTIHHWKNLEKGFAEIYRVLKKNGKVVLFTTLPEQTKSYWLYHYFPKMIEDSIAVIPTMSTLENAFNAAQLSIIKKEKYFVKPDLEDLFLYCGKHAPTMYFNEAVRNGISSFSLIAHQAEIKLGLKKLQEDINSGNISEIVKNYENDLGDYLFIVCLKR